jgi:hypothetical protein
METASAESRTTIGARRNHPMAVSLYRRSGCASRLLILRPG